MKFLASVASVLLSATSLLLVNGEQIMSASSPANTASGTAAATASACLSTNPLLVWSGSDKVLSLPSSSQQQESVFYYVDSSVEASDAMKMILSSNSNGFQSLFTDAKATADNTQAAVKPSVVVGFVFDDVDGIDISQSQTVKRIIDNDAKSSIVVSFVKQSTLTEDNDFIDQFSIVAKSSNFNLVELDGSKSDISSQVSDAIKSNSGNGNIAIIITFNKDVKLSNVDKSVIASIQKQLNNVVSDGKYISFIASRVCNAVPEAFWNGREKFINNRRVLAGGSASTPVSSTSSYSNSTWKARTRPEVLTGMVSTLLLGLLLLVYFCCMHDIQAGSSFVAKYPAKGKEFN